MSDDLSNRFDYHAPDEEKVGRHERTRDTLHVATAKICTELPEGREKSLFITKMEEAMFWANAAIARN
jgi:hypothetical protein